MVAKIPPPKHKISFFSRFIYSPRLLLYVFSLGLLVRILIGSWALKSLDSDYAAIARSLTHGTGYSLGNDQPTACRTPGYPLILAGLMALFGEQTMPCIILNSIVGAINAVLCAWLGARIFNRSTGLTAGILYALIPYLVQKESTTEGSFVTLGLLAGLCLLWKGRDNKRFAWIALSGFMFALSYLVRPTTGLIPVFVSISLLSGIRKTEKRLWHFSAAIILLLTFTIVISPWALRNRIVFGHWYFGQTNFWNNVYIGNYARSFDIYPYCSLDNLLVMFPLKSSAPHANELEQELVLREQAIRQISRFSPKEILNRGCRKLVYLWSLRIVPYTNHTGNVAVNGQPLYTKRGLIQNLSFSLPYVFLIVFALWGVWQERSRRWLLFFTAGLLFAFSIPYIITVAYSRYTTQVYFVLILLAARGLVSVIGED